jgi:hypothetical protein
MEGKNDMNRKESIGRLLLSLLTVFIMVIGVFGTAVLTQLSDVEQPEVPLAASEPDIGTREVGEAPTGANTAEPTTVSLIGQTNIENTPDVPIMEVASKAPATEREEAPAATTETTETTSGTRGQTLDANGPYGTISDPLYEGEGITFESDVIGGNNMDYKFRWEVTGDGAWDGPGAAPDGWGDWGESDMPYTFLDNSMGNAIAQAWDGSMTTTSYTGDTWTGYDMTMNVGGYYYYNWGNQFTANWDITVTALGGYKAYYWWAYPYPYIPYYYSTIKLWDAQTQALLGQVGPLYPSNDDWAWGTLSTPVTLTAGNDYIVTMKGVPQSYSYPYYYCHPGSQGDDIMVDDDGALEFKGYRYYYGDSFPMWGPYTYYAWFCDMQYEWTEIVENVLEDDAEIFVDNVAPVQQSPLEMRDLMWSSQAPSWIQVWMTTGGSGGTGATAQSLTGSK